jgi:hypothetical protein
MYGMPYKCPTGTQKIPCTGQCGAQKNVVCVIEAFLLFLAQHVIDHIVAETNMHAAYFPGSSTVVSRLVPGALRRRIVDVVRR